MSGWRCGRAERAALTRRRPAFVEWRTNRQIAPAASWHSQASHLTLFPCPSSYCCSASPSSPRVPPTRQPSPTSPPAPQAADSTQWEADIVAFEKADSVVRRRPGGVVFVGSSSIRLWDTLGDDFPGVATDQPRLRRFAPARFDVLRRPHRRPRTSREQVVVYAGDNDLDEGRTPQQVRDDFAALVDQAAPGTAAGAHRLHLDQAQPGAAGAAAADPRNQRTRARLRTAAAGRGFPRRRSRRCSAPTASRVRELFLRRSPAHEP